MNVCFDFLYNFFLKRLPLNIIFSGRQPRQGVKVLQRFMDWLLPYFLIDLLHSINKEYKDKLQNCSCNQFHYIGTYKQVETNSMTKNRVGNNGSEKWIEKTLRLLIG